MLFRSIQNTFSGNEDQDPGLHLSELDNYCDASKPKGLTKEVVLLKIFKFSLAGRAMEWFKTLPHKSIMNWEGLVKIFMLKFSPNFKKVELVKEVMNFSQDPTESFVQTTERYFGLIRNNFIRGISEEVLYHMFYFGLNEKSKSFLDCSAGGCFMQLSKKEGEELLQNIVINAHQWGPNETASVNFMEEDIQRGGQYVLSDELKKEFDETMKVNGIPSEELEGKEVDTFQVYEKEDEIYKTFHSFRFQQNKINGGLTNYVKNHERVIKQTAEELEDMGHTTRQLDNMHV